MFFNVNLNSVHDYRSSHCIYPLMLSCSNTCWLIVHILKVTTSIK
uniref:Uncharacterized protein n=1 Tax=Anguilla anguilla TaxID=7936 RepID=A0A0E9RK60_ANGAN